MSTKKSTLKMSNTHVHLSKNVTYLDQTQKIASAGLGQMIENVSCYGSITALSFVKVLVNSD